ncbi:hypothetical protein IH785_17860 [candidate division KSB1 bacterium]|nr:hypothetical protein [candidate division KSB1 bacterium]
MDQDYWQKWGKEIDKYLQDMDEFGRTKCRLCGSYKFTNDIAICMDCSTSISPLRPAFDK